MITGSGSQKGSTIGVSTLCRRLHHGPHCSRMTPHFCGMPLAHRLPAPRPCSMDAPGVIKPQAGPWNFLQASVLVLTRCFRGFPCGRGRCRLRSGGSASGCILGRQGEEVLQGDLLLGCGWEGGSVIRHNLGGRMRV